MTKNIEVAFLESLTAQQASYCIPWGYENQVVDGSDIDLLINYPSLPTLTRAAKTLYGETPRYHPEYSGSHVRKPADHLHLQLGPFDIWTGGFCVNTEDSPIKGPRGTRRLLSHRFSREVLNRKVKKNGIYYANWSSQAAMTILRIAFDSKHLNPSRRRRILLGKEFGVKEICRMLLLAIGDKQIPDSMTAMLS